MSKERQHLNARQFCLHNQGANMAINLPYGDNHRIGAVRSRS